jgi:molybdate transport system substrate-binding protein
MRRGLIVLACMISLVVAACDKAPNQEITVFAASSLTNAFEELATAFEDQHENSEVKLNFASSSTLSAQIVEGAEADVFASANNAQMTVIQDANLVKGEPQTFARNQLVVVVRKEVEMTSLHDLISQGIKIVMAAPEVPIRVYTDQMLDNLEAIPEYGIEYTAAIQRNTVSEEENVRQLVLKVSLGEADAAFVYASDVTPDIAESVYTLPIPDDVNVIASYPIAAISDDELADAFVEFVLSAEGQAILAKWGFLAAA